MNQELQNRVVQILTDEPMTLQSVADRLGVSYMQIYNFVTRCKQVEPVGEKKMSRGRPVLVYGKKVPGSVSWIRPTPEEPVVVSYPHRICEAELSPQRAAVNIKRTFGQLDRDGLLTVYESRGNLYATLPSDYAATKNPAWIGTYLPSVRLAEICEDYAHHLEGRMAA